MKQKERHGWRKVRLGEICSDISYGYTTSAIDKPIGPKLLRITDIVPDRIDWRNVPYCEISEENKAKYKLEIGDIVIARTGATTGYNKIIKTNENAVFASYLIRYKIDTSIAHPFYVGHILRSFSWKGFVGGVIGGSAQPGANAKQFATFQFFLPPLPEQKAIAEVLSSLDDKIDLLHRQNKTLEDMAQALFRKWFVEDADEGWEVGKIEDLTVRMNSGGTPSTKEAKYYNGSINWFSTKELQDKFLYQSERQITSEGLENSSAKLFPRDTVLMSIYAAPTVGRLGILDKQSSFNQAAVGLVAKKEIGYRYIFLLLKNLRKKFHGLASGAAQQNLNVGLVKKFPILIPDQETIDKFNQSTQSIFDKVRTNQSQIRTLEKLRDALLPKLMSGDVRTSIK